MHVYLWFLFTFYFHFRASDAARWGWLVLSVRVLSGYEEGKINKNNYIMALEQFSSLTKHTQNVNKQDICFDFLIYIYIYDTTN